MDFFRAVVASEELSPRVLALTKRVISLNAANYTAWHVRRECLYYLKVDLNEELEYVEECADTNPKNYQVWYHRRALIEKLGDGTREPQFVAQILEATDAKNYHAWAHRQWAVQTFNLWEGELEFSDFLIRDDVRNNSAWNHRWFVLTKAGTIKMLDNKVALQELAYVQRKTELAISNECPYNYLRALSSRSHVKLQNEEVLSWLESLLASATVTAVPLRTTLVDAYTARGDKMQAVQLCLELANKLDTTRREYWRWRAAQLTEPPS